jgi:hypothetical protein
MDTLASARLRVPTMERWTYLDVAGTLPSVAHDARRARRRTWTSAW